MRVHELATELAMESRELIRACHRLEILVKNHMSALGDDEVEQLRAQFAKPAKQAGPAPETGEPAGPAAGTGKVLESEPTEQSEPRDRDLAEKSSSESAEPEPQNEKPEPQNEKPEPQNEKPEPQNEKPEPQNENEEDRQPTEEEEKYGRRRGRGRGRGRGRRGHLAEDDPYWQFGTPVEYWGASRNQGQTTTRDPSGLSPDDPYWQFGSPPDTWGSTRQNQNQQQGRHDRPRKYLECRHCGVKIEKKRSHGDRKVKCPFCNRWMREVK